MFKNLGIIGFGNMGQAFYAAIHQTFPKINYLVYDKVSKTVPSGVMSCASADELIKNSDVILLAVKPQDFTTLAQETNNDFGSKVIISIMAGVKIEKILNQTNCTKVIRAMPNVGIKCSAGVIGWKATPDVSNTELADIKNIFSSTGLEIELKDENQINAITALSGSGPAYFYHLGAAMKEAAAKYGFSKKNAEKIAQQTFIGAAKILEQEKKTFSEMEKVITSKGGTTEAALKCFEENSFSGIIEKGISSANDRADELSS